MNIKARRATLYLLLIGLLAACVPLRHVTSPSEPGPTVVLGTVAVPTATLVPTGTPTPAATPSPTPASDGSPANGSPSSPILVTFDQTGVRTGPGMEYETTHVLSGGTSAPILGRSADDAWWAIPGPGDGPGPVGWVAREDAQVHGDTASVPVLLAGTVLPLLGQAGPPPADRCVVLYPGTGAEGAYVRAAPADGAGIVGLLGASRWAEALGIQDSWYQIVLVSGGTGWIPAAEVTANARCTDASPPGPPTPWPEPAMVGNPNLPPADLCAVQDVGPGPDPVNVRLGPGADFAVVAWLGVERWAQVIESRDGWYQVRTGPGEVGWVDGKEVNVSGLCTAPTPTPTASANVPLIMDPGAPPSNVCVASLPPDVPPVDVYLGPGMQYALVARLGNWAEVLKSSGHWHMIWIVPGNVGWVEQDQVALSEPCPTVPGP